MNTAEEIRKTLKQIYPDVDDDAFSIEPSGFVHEHPLIAIGVVLISSIVLGTTDPAKLVRFTKYSRRFVCGVATNMENSRLWKYDKYDRSSWSSGNLLPRNEREEDAFWDHVLIGEGSLRSADANAAIVEDTSLIFWNDKLAN